MSMYIVSHFLKDESEVIIDNRAVLQAMLLVNT